MEILVSNAAQIQPGSALETTPEDFEEVYRVNVGGAHRLVRAFGTGMVARRRGDLIFVTSDVVAHPRPRMSAYVASKWGLEGFVTALQMELEGTGSAPSSCGPARRRPAWGWTGTPRSPAR